MNPNILRNPWYYVTIAVLMTGVLLVTYWLEVPSTWRIITMAAVALAAGVVFEHVTGAAQAIDIQRSIQREYNWLLACDQNPVIVAICDHDYHVIASHAIQDALLDGHRVQVVPVALLDPRVAPRQ